MGRGNGSHSRSATTPRGVGLDSWEFPSLPALGHGPQGAPRAALHTVALPYTDDIIGAWTMLARAQVVGAWRGMPGRSGVAQTARATERHLAGQARAWLEADLLREPHGVHHRLSWLHDGKVVCATAGATSELPVPALPDAGWVLATVTDDGISYSWGRGRAAMTRRSVRAQFDLASEPCAPGSEGCGDDAHEQLLAGLIAPRLRRHAPALARPFGENWAEER